MDRRHFLQIAGAVGLAPALPVLPVAAAAPVPPTAIQYAWAAHYAQVHGTVSPARLTAALKVPPAVADGLMHKLTARGVIAAPSATGIGTATKPFHNPIHLRPTPQSLLRKAQDAAERLREFDLGSEEAPEVLPEDDTAPAVPLDNALD